MAVWFNFFFINKTVLWKEILCQQRYSKCLRTAKDVAKLNQTLSNLKTEIENLKQTRNNSLVNRNQYQQKQLLPLRLPEHYYRYYNYWCICFVDLFR